MVHQYNPQHLLHMYITKSLGIPTMNNIIPFAPLTLLVELNCRLPFTEQHGILAQWVELLPRNSRIPGLILCLGYWCRVSLVLLVLKCGLPLTLKKHMPTVKVDNLKWHLFIFLLNVQFLEKLWSGLGYCPMGPELYYSTGCGTGWYRLFLVFSLSVTISKTVKHVK